MTPHTLIDCQKYAAYHGGKCLSVEYVGMATSMLWECKSGHRFKNSFGNIFHQGQWCAECQNRHPKSLEYWKAKVKEIGLPFEVISKEWTNNKTKLRWRCRSGHEWDSRVHNVVKLSRI